MRRLLRYVVLPSEITEFERRYLERMNKIALVFFWLHPPVFALVAVLAGTSIAVAIGLSLAVMVGPTLAYAAFRARPRMVGMIYGVTAMLMGGALVYIGQGPMQIEMHFYFFVLIALLAVFGNPMVIITAAVTVAAHHFVVWLLVPHGVFNYEASVWSVLVHAIFVVIESVAACFVARSFFDNVIGLEQIVTNRTSALDARNRDMARILDSVAQGFVTVGFDGMLGREWSRALATWFGEPKADVPIWDYLFTDPDRAAWMKFGFDSLIDDLMPFEVILDQFPHRITKGGREFRLDFRGIGEPATSILVVVSDITDELARQRAEGVQRELIAVVERAFRDRAGFGTFMAETDELVRRCATPRDEELAELRRRIHTLKGNTALFGVTTMSNLCHEIEDEIDETGEPPAPASRAKLTELWDTFRERISHILGITNRRSLVVDWDDYQAVISAITVVPEPEWAGRLRDWGKAATRPRLEQCGDYARMLAGRLGKPAPEIEILDHGVKVHSEQYAKLWSAFVHAIRNMVDHGIEAPDVREAAGKPAAGHLALETRICDGELWLEISDDGAGIDWERVAAKARTLGVPATTQTELEEAVFTSGVSTAARVSELSGRGVGMDALRATCRDYGGRVQIRSERGKGTRIACVLPHGRVRASTTHHDQEGVRVGY